MVALYLTSWRAARLFQRASVTEHPPPAPAVCEAPRTPHPALAVVHSVDHGRPGGVEGTGLTLPSDWWHDVTFVYLLIIFTDSSMQVLGPCLNCAFCLFIAESYVLRMYADARPWRIHGRKKLLTFCRFFSFSWWKCPLKHRSLKFGWVQPGYGPLLLFVLIPWWVAGCFQFGTIMNINMWTFTWISVFTYVW